MPFRDLCAFHRYYTIPQSGVFMRKALRTTLSLVVSLVLLSALTMAAPGGKNSDKHKNNKQHHNPFAKLAFWRHHKNGDKKARKQTASRHAQARTAHTKAASAKQGGDKKDRKQEQRANHKGSDKKAPAASKTVAQQDAQDAIALIGP
jgi:hypothetical protein